MPTLLSKQPWEELTYGMDFSDALGSGRTVSSVVSVEAQSSRPGGLDDLNITNPTVDGDSKVAFKVAGGSDGEVYPIRARIQDSNGNKLEGDGVLKVREI